MGRGRNVETEQGVGRGPIQHPASRKPVKREEDRARETDSAELVDSRVERLGRYLSNRLNMDSDSDDEIGGFMLGEDDGAALIDVSSGDCVTDLLPRLPATAVKAHFTSLKTDVAVYCTAESSAGGVGRGEAASASRSPDFDDASVQFGDGTGLFEYDCSDLTVKNHGPVGGGETEKRGVSVGRRVELVSEDDGWNSEDSDFCSNFPSHPAVETPNLPSYAMYEDDVWVDEVKAVFAKHKKDDSKELRELLAEMFSIHTDVYALILAFVRRAGRTRHPPKSPARLALAQFKRWLKEREMGQGKENQSKETLQNPPVLRESHQEEVLSLMTDTHLNMMDELCQVFRLRSADTDLLIDLVHRLLAEDKMKEAVTYAWTFRIQSHFGLEEMLLPLIAMDKINLIEKLV
ncbi:Exonuclease mut-7 homolog [Geodia barretti]|nr:Exonuclease mut-7 homolog [Geodia barretti]